MTFREHFLPQFEELSVNYRSHLHVLVELFKGYVEGYPVTDDAAEVGIKSLQAEKMPVFIRWEGEVTEDDREWFKRTAPKWDKILQEYIDNINQLKTIV